MDQRKPSRKTINRYQCPKGHYLITKLLTPGTTPMFLMCQHPDCNEKMVSHMYATSQNQKASHEWYRPNKAQIRTEVLLEVYQHQLDEEAATRLYDSMLEHRLNGGLFLREAGKEVRKTKLKDYAEGIKKYNKVQQG